MSRAWIPLASLVWLMFLASCDNNPAPPAKPKLPEGTVALSAAETAHLDVRTTAAQPASYTPQVQGYGVVVGFDTLAQADSDVATAEAATRQSQASLARQRHLLAMNATTREAVDLAQKQAATDASLLILAERKEAVTFGRDAPWLVAARHAAILADLSSGRMRLVKASFPIGVLEGAPPSTLIVSRLGQTRSGASWTSRDIWSAPADNTVPGRTISTLLGGSDLSEGERVLVSAPVGTPIAGVRIPGDSVVLSEGQAWCYILARPGVFVRTPIDLSRPLQGGYFVASGVAAGASVVVQGQSLLLAHERANITAPASD